MTRIFLALTLAMLLPGQAVQAQNVSADYGAMVERAVENYALPRFARFADAIAVLDASATHCGGDETELRTAYHTAFDTWMAVSHLRLGPTEENDAAFAIAFWPDPKGFTAKTIARLIRERDGAVQTGEAFAEVSIAARGLFALERLLFDPNFEDAAEGYRCALLGAITRDLSALSAGIEEQWRDTYGPSLRGTGAKRPFATDKETVQAFYSTMKTGAEFTMTARIDRPLGADDRPRPKRAEAWRSERTNRNIELSLLALEDMFEVVFAPDMPEQAASIVRGELYSVRRLAEALPAPLRIEVTGPLGRGRLITLRFGIVELLELFEGLLRPSLGLSLTFNALDGD